jgi:Domain of unknown function (DUF1840)
MLVTFHSKAWGSITMFGDDAVTLLKLAGHSGTVPGALLAAQIPAALARLEQALPAAGAEAENTRTVPPGTEEVDSQPPVSTRRRAYPLMQMLSEAARRGCDVMWEEGQPAV